MNVALVTGISGQDGGYLAERLVAEGSSIHGVVCANDPEAESLAAKYPDIELHEVDLANPEALEAVVRLVQPGEIYSLGGISSVPFSWENPVATGMITGVAVAALLDAALGLDGNPHILQASSAEIFGRASDFPQSETTPVAPTSPYGAAKAYAHYMIAIYRSRGLHATSCLLYNHESPRRPESFVTRKITMAAVKIAAGDQDLLELGNLEVERDWGWAPDYVDAMIRAQRFERAEDFVIATGESHTVAEFAAAAFAAAGVPDWESHVVINPEFVRAVDPSRMLGDSSKARRLLGWAPSVTFEGMVARMVAADRARLYGPESGTAA